MNLCENIKNIIKGEKMEVIELFKDSLKYPTKDWNKVLILGILFLIVGISNILQNNSQFFNDNPVISIIILVFALISMITYFIISGYSLNITRKTIALEEEIPNLEWSKNIIDGLKVFVIEIVYLIIPFIITFITAYFTGALNYLIQIVSYAIIHGTAATIPQSLLLNALSSFMIVILVGIILFIIFYLLSIIAVARLAENDSLVAALNMKDTFNKIGEIGWGNYIIWFILFIAICIGIAIILIIVFSILIFIIGMVAGIVIASIIISMLTNLLFSPYITMFSSRAVGLLYNESENS